MSNEVYNRSPSRTQIVAGSKGPRPQYYHSRGLVMGPECCIRCIFRLIRSNAGASLLKSVAYSGLDLIHGIAE